jgi:hypothetical protein
MARIITAVRLPVLWLGDADVDQPKLLSDLVKHVAKLANRTRITTP